MDGKVDDEISLPALARALPPGRQSLAMVGVLSAIALATLDTAIANTALPTIAAKLGVSADVSVWVVTIYQLVLVATLLPVAALGEIVGQRIVHLCGLAIFTASSLLCACAWSFASLVAARALQGAGAAAIMAANVALIRFIYPPKRLGRGIGLNALVVGLSFVVGPTVASAILLVAPWPWLFGVNVPIGIASLVLGWSSVPESSRSDRRFDLTAAVLTAATLSLFVFGLGEASHVAPWQRIAAEWAIAAICGIGLLWRQSGRQAPIVAIDLLRLPPFALSAVTAICAFAARSCSSMPLVFPKCRPDS